MAEDLVKALTNLKERLYHTKTLAVSGSSGSCLITFEGGTNNGGKVVFIMAAWCSKIFGTGEISA